MRVATALMYDHAVSSFSAQQKKIYESQQQISTGQKIQDPHQDPIAAVNIDRLEGLESRMESYQRNIGTLNERFALEDTTMSDMSNTYQRMRELTVQAGNTALPQESRIALAAEMREGLNTLASLANSVNSQGYYSFAGAEGARKPVDTFEASGMVAANITGDGTARVLEISEGREMKLGDNVASNFLRVESDNALRTRPELSNSGSAQAMSAFVSDPALFTGQNFSLNFDSANTFDVVAEDGTVLLADQDYLSGDAINYGGVRTAIVGVPAIGDSFTVETSSTKDAFTSINQMIGVLRSSDNDAQVSAMVDQTLDDINALQQKLSVAQVEGGAKMNSLEKQENNNADLSLQMKKSLSAIQDTDYVTAIARLQQEMTVFDAAQATFAKIQQSSLFNHI